MNFTEDELSKTIHLYDMYGGWSNTYQDRDEEDATAKTTAETRIAKRIHRQVQEPFECHEVQGLLGWAA
jgi:hypothetical protein